jgi:enamine deaminase RidA (YjgF/YER057c/UK114 family)
MHIEAKLGALGYELPAVPTPIANYVPAVRTSNLVFLSGHGPRQADGSLVRGKLGANLTKEQGYDAARLTALQLLASLREAIGDLDRVTRIVKVLGMVNCTADFVDPPAVINGASDLFVAAFGNEIGKHARSAVGLQSLPGGMCVEIEMVVEVAG